MGYKYIDAEAFVGKEIVEAAIADGNAGPNCDVNLSMKDGSQFWIGHVQDCCENVSIHDFSQPLEQLIGAGPIVRATKEELKEWPADIPKPGCLDSFTITVLTIATDSVEVRVRWIGESNGYYGEGIDIEEIK